MGTGKCLHQWVLFSVCRWGNQAQRVWVTCPGMHRQGPELPSTSLSWVMPKWTPNPYSSETETWIQKRKRSLKHTERNFQVSLGEKFEWAMFSRLLFQPSSGSMPPRKAPSSPCSRPMSQPVLTWISFPQLGPSEEKGSNTSLPGFVNSCQKGNIPRKM